MNLKKWLFFWGLLIMLIPPLCNFFVLTPAHPCYRVAGNVDTWIMFFGSYVAAVISSVISFTILWYNRKDSADQLRKLLEINASKENLNRLHSEISAIQSELAERFEQYDLSIMLNLGTLCEKNPNALTCNLSALQRLHAKFYGLQQSAAFLYKEDKLSYELWEQYDSLMENTMGLLVEYIAFIESIREEPEITNGMQKKLLELSAKVRYNIESNATVVKYAQRYIETLHHLYSEEEANINTKINNIRL